MALALIVLLLSFHQTVMSTNHTCHASNNLCDSTLHCESGKQCIISCSNDNACNGAIIQGGNASQLTFESFGILASATIYCPVDSACIVSCNAPNSCSGLTIYGGDSSTVTYSSSAESIGVEIYCENTDSCQLTEHGIGNSKALQGITVYADDSFNTISIQCGASSQCFNNLTLYCDNNAFSCTVNPQTFDSCLLPSPSPCDITNTPTSNPTAEPTAEPTVEPTYVPTLEPTVPTMEPTNMPTEYDGRIDNDISSTDVKDIKNNKSAITDTFLNFFTDNPWMFFVAAAGVIALCIGVILCGVYGYRVHKKRQLQSDSDRIYDLHQQQLKESEATMARTFHEETSPHTDLTTATELATVAQRNKEQQHINLIDDEDDDNELEAIEYDEVNDPLDIDNESEASHDAMYTIPSNTHGP